MINQNVVDIINSGNAWAFVGSGVSVDAGLPDWQMLYARTFEGLTQSTPPPAKISDIPRHFDKLVRDHGKDAVHTQVKIHLGHTDIPGELHKLIALWPFHNYVTTNYDSLLDEALKLYQGWVSVGNTVSENKMISGDVSGTIWHPHGMIGLTAQRSRLIISQDDYDEMYSAGSVIQETLRVVLRMRSIIFIGFGFNDPDLLQLLKTVARQSTPDRPAYAFLTGMTEDKRREFRNKFNVVTIPYEDPAGDHSELLVLLRYYTSFIVGRDIEIGSRQTSTPSYDPEVTSLIVQNALYDGSVPATQEIRDQIVRASLIAALSENESMTETELEQYARPSSTTYRRTDFSLLLQRMENDGLVLRSGYRVRLTPAAMTLLKERKGRARLKFDQFLSSLEHRVKNHPIKLRTDSCLRVSKVAADFFQSVCKDRGLAIAQNMAGGGEQHAQYRTIAVIKELPKWSRQCQTKEETQVLVNVSVGVLSEPRQPEKVYLGFLTQAYFGKHIAGFDEESISIRRQLLSETTFVLDSHFLIVLLAKDCVGHNHAVEIHRLLSEARAPMVATKLILVETVEHLDYAIKKVGIGRQRVPSTQLFEAVQEGTGLTNAFMTGYYETLSQRNRVSFASYVVDTLGATGSDVLPFEMILSAVEKLKICADPLQDWPRYNESLWHDSSEMQEQIRSRRENYGSYKHERQVEAEAQVAGVVCAIRNDRIQAPGTKSSHAFFLTESPILDGLDGLPQHLCIKPGSLHQWLLSTIPFTDEMAANVFDHLLLELVESGVQFVPRDRIIRAFGEIVQAGRETIKKVVLEHKTLIEEMYGAESAAVLSNVDDLLAPGAAEYLKMTVLRESRERLAVEREKRIRAEKKLRELENLRRYTSPRKREKAKQRKRAAQSKPKTKRQRQRELRRRKARRQR